MNKKVLLTSGIKISKMACEDNFLRLDGYNFSNELEKLVFDGYFSRSDIEELYQKKLITSEEFETLTERK